jgi:hypothetical protein
MRRRVYRILIGVCILALFALGVSGAQEKSARSTAEHSRTVVVTHDQDEHPPGPFAYAFGPQGDGNSFVFVSSEMGFGGKTVKGAPYSAQAVSENVQILGDGNRIVRKNTSTVYRDSEGRTRQEQTIQAVGPFAVGGEPRQTVMIMDPVANVHYILDPSDRSARKMGFRFDVKVRAPMKEGEASAGKERHEVHTEVITAGGGTGSGTIRIQHSDESNHTAKTESLGKQMIEGVQAEGTRSTITIDAGKIGNELPINIVTERWYSPELQTVVMHKHSDPRFGENTFRLTNISRAEPARSLFEVPADYTIKAGGPGAEMKMRIEREMKRPRGKSDDNQ